MTINERVRYFRKDILHMNQTEFARSIGMKQTSVSSFEKEGATVSDQSIKAISSVYSIREEWLRAGEEPMYKTQETFDLNKFAKEHGASDLDLKIVKAYFALDPQIRKMLLDHFKAELEDDGQSDHCTANQNDVKNQNNPDNLKDSDESDDSDYIDCSEFFNDSDNFDFFDENESDVVFTSKKRKKSLGLQG